MSMSKTPTQREMILDYIREFGSIDPKEAYIDIGCMKLATRISELKYQGYNITSETVTGKNRWGKKKRFKRYRLAEERGRELADG